MSVIADGYLAAARESDLLADLDGHDCVIGEYVDPFTGVRQCLAEYAAPVLLRTPDGGRTLLRFLARRFPDAMSALLRTPPAVSPGPPWRRHLSYLLRGAPASPADRPPMISLPVASHPSAAGRLAIRVAKAREEDTRQVRDWLVQAFQAAGLDQDTPVDQAVARAQVEALLSAPGRQSLIAWSAGRRIGHATLLCDAYDDVTNLPFVELLDILVDLRAQRPTATDVLVAESTALAGRLGKPLIGSVVHAHTADREAHGAAVVDALTVNGWEPHHNYWWAPLARNPETPAGHPVRDTDRSDVRC